VWAVMVVVVVVVVRVQIQSSVILFTLPMIGTQEVS
jgi:hypothetical protein